MAFNGFRWLPRSTARELTPQPHPNHTPKAPGSSPLGPQGHKLLTSPVQGHDGRKHAGMSMNHHTADDTGDGGAAGEHGGGHGGGPGMQSHGQSYSILNPNSREQPGGMGPGGGGAGPRQLYDHRTDKMVTVLKKKADDKGAGATNQGQGGHQGNKPQGGHQGGSVGSHFAPTGIKRREADTTPSPADQSEGWREDAAKLAAEKKAQLREAEKARKKVGARGAREVGKARACVRAGSLQLCANAA